MIPTTAISPKSCNHSAELVRGFCDPRFRGLFDLFQHYLETGQEVGASIVVNINGEDVVDLWGGYYDENKDRLWDENTIVNVFSSTKTVTSLAALMLIDRGIISPYDKVSRFWPEFAAAGKEDIEIRHIISHTSGVAGWDEKVTLEDICDFEKATTLLAAQAPWWLPGTASGYHSLTHGFLIGEVIRRVLGTTLKTFVDDEIAAVLSADFQLGAKPSDLHRVSDVIPYTPRSPTSTFPDPNSPAGKQANNPPFKPDMANSPLWRDSELGAGNGHSNARGLAKILSVISLGGEVNGVRLLKPETIELIFQEQANGTDLIIGWPFRFGVGYGIRGPGVVPSWIPEGKICYWSGLGGSVVIMDLERNMTIAYAMNKLYDAGLGSDLTVAYVEEIYKSMLN